MNKGAKMRDVNLLKRPDANKTSPDKIKRFGFKGLFGIVIVFILAMLVKMAKVRCERKDGQCYTY